MSILHLPETVPDTSRVKVMMALIGVGLLAIVGRLWYLQVAHGDELWLASETNRTRLIRRVPPRGQMEDRNGRVLASNRREIVVSVVPAEIKKNPGVLPLLAKLLGSSEEDLRDIIDHDRIGPFDPVRVAIDVGIEEATGLEEHRLDLPGVIVGPEPVRTYPDGPLFGHVLGQMGQIPPEELRKRRDEGYKPGDFCGKLGL